MSRMSKQLYGANHHVPPSPAVSCLRGEVPSRDAHSTPSRPTRAMTVIGGSGFSRTKRFDPTERLALIHNAKQRTKGVSLRPLAPERDFSRRPPAGGLKRDYSLDDLRPTRPSPDRPCPVSPAPADRRRCPEHAGGREGRAQGCRGCARQVSAERTSRS